MAQEKGIKKESLNTFVNLLKKEHPNAIILNETSRKVRVVGDKLIHRYAADKALTLGLKFEWNPDKVRDIFSALVVWY